MSEPSHTVEDILGPDGLLAGALDDFEFRSSQMRMALLIQDALKEERPVIVEAGTGTGKTFGYLVPVILSGKRAVISTGTKNLQEQVFNKDIPLLRRATGLHIDAMMMKGRKNYLCLQRYHQFFSQASLLKTGLGGIGKRLEKWLEKTRFGDRAELPWLADDDALWDALSATSEQCVGAGCMFLDECFLGRLRSRAAKSRIIIVNHHLFFADLKVKEGGFGEIIPRFQAAVFDEAHNIEEIATTYMGDTLSTNQLLELVKDLEKETEGLSDLRADLRQHLAPIRTGSEGMRELFKGREDKGRLDAETLARLRKGPGLQISEGLAYVHGKAGLENQDRPSLIPLVMRAGEQRELLERILQERDPGWLNWYERRKRSLILHASPLEISERLRQGLYAKLQTVAYTSATLSTNRTFAFIKDRLGLPEETMEGMFPSHFDFENQTLMYIPGDLPSPGSSAFGASVAARVVKILEATRGRALVLFTSYSNLNLVHDRVKDRLPYIILRQGDAPRSVLLEEFRRDVHSILLATGSFWQGVDVPGETLSCLIIDKLPFDSPGEPLTGARIDALREKGRNPFMEYQVPSAIISLKQGLGRLIRKSSDRGILAVLDIRLRTSRYGRFFLDSLPGIPVTGDLSRIRLFFEEQRDEGLPASGGFE